jgi:hypothetical protein
MKRVACILLALGTAAACGGDLSSHPGKQRLVVEIVPVMGSPGNGSIAKPLPLNVGTPFPFRITVRALLPDGTQDTSFTRYVRISSKPGSIGPLSGNGTDGRNLLLNGGVSDQADLQILNPFGTTYIEADDLGYIPADPLASPPPKCANGIDDDGDGLIDFPADPGCAFANDDSEEGGTFDEGVSEPIFVQLPRIADARGLKCDSRTGCSGSGQTPFPKEQLLLDTGWRDNPTPIHPMGAGFDYDTVIIRVSADGFYALDVSDAQRPPSMGPTGFNALFAYNFNSPPQMRVCDRVKSLAGTAAEFFGFTQLSYPTWELEFWDPSKRPCLVPEPTTLRPGDINDVSNLLRLTASLVRVETKGTKVTISAALGPDNVPEVKNDGKICGPTPMGATPRATCFVATPNASNCDFNGDGKIDFAIDAPEGLCSNDCGSLTINPGGCSEYSNYKSRSQFVLLVADENNQVATIQANASTAAGLDVVASRGKQLRSFTGTLTFFSGGSQYTIEARCDDDVITDLNAIPLDSGKACVLPRTVLELNPQ